MATHQQAELRAIQLLVQFDLDDYDFAFNRRKRGCGLCRFATATQRGRIELSIHFVLMNGMEAVEDTLRHEIAHALAFRRLGHNGHGRPWIDACEETGAKPERSCSTAIMPAGHLVATCPKCNVEFRRFQRPRQGRIFCRGCGPEFGQLQFRPMSPPQVV